jgi:magnesium chelatase accessory protein
MSRAPDWSIEGRDWPNRSASRFVESGGLRWHVQMMGQGPVLLLLHGTGAATHSWRDVAPMLARTHAVVAPDLPGHGFTGGPKRSADLSLPNVARWIGELLRTLGLSPEAVVGHSAGAAIGVRMALDNPNACVPIVGINAALLPFPGPLGPWAPMLARTLFDNPFSIGMFSYRAAQPGAIGELMRSTGSSLDERGLDLYARLFRTRAHLEGTIGLMAHWDLHALRRDLVNLRAPLTLIVGQRDRAVPPSSSETVRALVKHARVETAPGLGHLAHEESPELLAGMILGALQQGR